MSKDNKDDIFSSLMKNEIQWKDTIEFVPCVKYGKVIKVYDGDTIVIACKFPSLEEDKLYRFHVRLNGIDTPELKSKNEEEKEVSMMIQQKLYDLIFGKMVMLENVKTDKYGRLLADVLVQNGSSLNVNNWLLENNYAVVYSGKTKNPPKSWKKFVETGAYS